MKPPLPYFLHRFLRRKGMRISAMRVLEVYARHPLPHSIRSLSDTLDELQVENMVCRLEFAQLFEIEGPFIVVAGKDEYPFHIVERLDHGNQKVSLCSASGSKVGMTFDQFRSVWDGTVLMAEKDGQTPEEPWLTYRIKQGLQVIDRTAKYWIVALSVYFLICGVMQNPELSDLRYLVKAAGAAISLLVIAKAFFDPRLAQRFCSLGKHADCNEVFQSAGAKLLGWVSLGELSLAYFGTSLLWGIFLAANPAATFPVLDTLALLFVVYSLIWQVGHRKWCTLCLAIDAVLIIDFLTELLWGGFRHISFYPDLMNFGFLFGLCLLSLRALVRMADQNRMIPQLKIKHEFLLSSSELFWSLLARQPEESENSDRALPVCNYLEAEHTLTVVMNPSCPKCAKVHDAIASLAGYRINLVFVINEGDKRSHDAALKIISSGITDEWSETNKIIAAWYGRHEFPEGCTIHPRAEKDLQAQLDYCQKIKVTGTPTILVDNRRLPEIYDAEDLKILL